MPGIMIEKGNFRENSGIFGSTFGLMAIHLRVYFEF